MVWTRYGFEARDKNKENATVSPNLRRSRRIGSKTNSIYRVISKQLNNYTNLSGREGTNDGLVRANSVLGG
jgi:hypothetical protein